MSTFDTKSDAFSIAEVFKVVRPHLWVKNALVFVPLITHFSTSLKYIEELVFSFLAFTFASSAIYVFNDLMDIQSDRQSSVNRVRPFASGRLHVKHGRWLIPLLISMSVLTAYGVNTKFFMLLLMYISLSYLYTIKLKRFALLDIILLSVFLSTRLLGGTFASGISISVWLIGCSMFLFISLASIKRLAEIQQKIAEGEDVIHGRGYIIHDKSIIQTISVTSGYISILVFSLYINSITNNGLYSSPGLLWFVCPVMAVWINRILLLASRGEMSLDPIYFSSRDIFSIITGILIILIFTASKIGYIFV